MLSKLLKKFKSKYDHTTHLKISSSVTQIGDYAFTECSSLTQIIIPSSVTSFKKNAFSDCF